MSKPRSDDTLNIPSTATTLVLRNVNLKFPSKAAYLQGNLRHIRKYYCIVYA